MNIETDKQLVRLFENFPHTQVTESMTDSFQRACEGKPLSIITDIVDQFVFGRCDRSNKTFLPTVAEFTDHLERAAANWQRGQHKALEPPKPPTGPRTKAQRDRVKMLTDVFKAVRDREIEENKFKPEAEKQSLTYRLWAAHEYEVRVVDGVPVYARTGEAVL